MLPIPSDRLRQERSGVRPAHVGDVVHEVACGCPGAWYVASWALVGRCAERCPDCRRKPKATGRAVKLVAGDHGRLVLVAVAP